MALKGDPWIALAMARRMAQLVKTPVDRPIHVAMVYGFNKKLVLVSSDIGAQSQNLPYPAAIAALPNLLARRGDVNSFELPATLESAILYSASALRRSTAI
jgi:hypothetical protein